METRPHVLLFIWTFDSIRLFKEQQFLAKCFALHVTANFIKMPIIA